MLNKYTVLLMILLLILALSMTFYKSYEPEYQIDESAILFSSEDSSMNLDFDKMAHLIKDKRIVILGGTSDYGGTTSKFKTEFIKYLHSEHGYENVLFESGLYGMYKIKSDTSRLSESLWRFAYGSNEMADLWNYVGANRDIELSGFDAQMTGYLSYDKRAKDIDSILLANDIEIPSIIDSVKKTLPRLVYRGRNLSKLKQDSIIVGLKNIAIELNKRNELMEAKYFNNMADWFQCVWKYNWKSSKRLHVRDSLMADNLQFLLENRFKDEKVILWTLNSSSINTDKDYDNHDILFTPMGKRIKDVYGDAVFTLCTTSYGTESDKSPLYDKGSNRTMEYQLYMKGYKYALIDLSNVENRSFVTRVNQGMEFSGKWANMTDAIFYMEKEKAITY